MKNLSFEADEKERAVLPNGTANGRAELVLIHRRLLEAETAREEVSGVEGIVSEVLVRGSPEGIAAGLRGEIDDAPRVAAVFSRNIVRDHAEFLNDVLGRHEPVDV